MCVCMPMCKFYPGTKSLCTEHIFFGGDISTQRVPQYLFTIAVDSFNFTSIIYSCISNIFIAAMESLYLYFQ